MRLDLTWRSGHLDTATVHETVPLADSVRANRGVVIAFVHHGVYVGLFPALARAGMAPHLTPAALVFDEALYGWRGLQALRHRVVIENSGCRLIPSAGSRPEFERALDAGEVIALAFDCAGSYETDLLGQRRYMASGIARLASRRGSPIVPVSMGRRGGRLTLQVEVPIDTTGSSVREVQDAVADRMGAILLRDPAAHERPRVRWSVADPRTRPVTDPPPLPDMHAAARESFVERRATALAAGDHACPNHPEFRSRGSTARCWCGLLVVPIDE